MTMTGVQISGVKMGVEAMGGTLVINGESRITFNNGAGNYGVKVGSAVESANLTNVRIEGTGGNGVGSKGVIVDRTKMIMEEVRISNVAMGVEVMGAGKLLIKGGEIGFKGDYGVSLKEGGAAFLGEVTIKGNGTGQEGIKLNGGMVDLFRTNIREVQKGMSVTNGGVQMLEGEIGFKGEYGISLTKSTAALMGVTIKG
ncbi:hypothetical protein, partial [Bartonella bovis]|uniref:hypothetical protein n=1 Tax=Bartonella bovis TaxID=155194 RepID=UPI0019579DF0